jgi:acetolactate decarboxylase
LQKKISGACLLTLMLILTMGGLFSACARPLDRETLQQFSTIDALMNGLYNGVTTVSQILKFGDTGVGTFERLDGEMVILEGKVYQVSVNGKVTIKDGATLSPFAEITYFSQDREISLPAGLDFAGVQKYIDSQLPSTNMIYAFKFDGKFNYMKTRSVPAQNKPYPGLAEVTQKQAVFEFNDIEGAIVGFRCPVFVNGVNVAGYHWHFLSKNRDSGGHVLDFTVSQAEALVDDTPEFRLVLPDQNNDFYKTDFSKDQSSNVQKVESK